jgi:hypothetical protein
MASVWAKMPCGWQQQESIHQTLRRAPVGEAIASLKLYLAMCMLANFNPTSVLPNAGSIKLSLVAFARKTGMTKPLAIKGMRLLESAGLIRREAGKPITYVLAEYDTCSHWTKLPKRYLIGSDPREMERLVTLPNRGQEIFEALQFYIYIASIRDRGTHKARVTYETITATLGMSRNAVSKVISILCAKDLISMRPEESFDGFRPKNVYWLLGRVEEVAKPANPMPTGFI